MLLRIQRDTLNNYDTNKKTSGWMAPYYLPRQQNPYEHSVLKIMASKNIFQQKCRRVLLRNKKFNKLGNEVCNNRN